MEAIEPFEQGDEIGAAFGLRGHDSELAGNEVERAHQGDFLRLAGRRNAQVGAPVRPSAGQIRMGQRLQFIGNQQHNVARKAPFLRSTPDGRECEMRCKVRRAISSARAARSSRPDFQPARRTVRARP